MFELVEIVSDKSDPTSASLSVLEFSFLPWIPKRIYWLDTFVDGATRGLHAHKKLNQLFIVMRGSVEIQVYEGTSMKNIELAQGGNQLLLGPGLWRVIHNASSDAQLLVVADSPYDESDYIRSWEEYLEWHKIQSE